MMTENTQITLTPEELALRRRQVRKVILIRGSLLGLIVAGWWIFFAPDAVVDADMKTPLGIAAGLIATGGYFFMLRHNLLNSQTS